MEFSEEEKDLALKWFSMNREEIEAHLYGQDALAVSGKLGIPDDWWEKIVAMGEKLSSATKAELQQKVCVELDYCNSLTENRWAIIQVIAGCIIVDLGSASLPILLIAIVLIKCGYMDKLCNCKSKDDASI